MPPGNPEARAAAQLARAERRRAAAKLAQDGHTYEEIAQQLGYSSRQAAHRDVKAALAPAIKEMTEAGKEYLAQQIARLNEAHRDARAIFAEYRPQLVGGELSGDVDPDRPPVADQRLAALDRVIKVSERISKLLGLDAPTKTETKLDGAVSYQIAVTPDELEQL